MTVNEIVTYTFQDDGIIPNNSKLSVLLYPGVFKDQPNDIEEIFNKNNWLNSWTNGVFNYHHYHSNAHEVLGVMKGSATIQLGGEQGKEVIVAEGDVLVLPAGTGHKKIKSSPDFRVVGAYPNGMSHNMKTGEQSERPVVFEEISQVPLPERDPVYGAEGPLLDNWSS
ncbi:cupin domain-containing protein [Metabacillus arenae]|uniref:Cupin domain-containing protein n=1 Tax=Metabacillus arenae TaxID=2771434 RepID=A0A926NJF3_9BACI|nr:cupin domain-containing protein [Metabacillus arenae]MBD1381098.1 cupin domain-containing protein [Metabacillus arenae]